MIFGPLLARRQRLAQRVAHLGDVVGAIDLPHPFRADAAHRVDDAVVGLAPRVERARRQNVLAAGRGRIEIVDDQRHAVMLVEHGVADRGGEAVVPEAAVAHHRDRALVGRHVEGRGRGGPEAVAHRRRADVERRQDREQMAADVGGDVVLPELLLDQLHRREDRPLRTADAEARRPRRHDFGQRLHARVGEHRRRRRAAAARCRAVRARRSRGIRAGPSSAPARYIRRPSAARPCRTPLSGCRGGAGSC